MAMMPNSSECVQACPALLHSHFAARKVHTLDAGSPLVDGMDPHIAVILLQRKLIVIAVPAQDLEPLAAGKDTHLHGCIYDHVEDLPAVVGITGIAKERLNIEHLVQQESQISLRDEFFSHGRSPFMK